MNSKVDPLACWSQLPLGAVVRIRPRVGGSCAGRQGVVVERLDDAIDGFARYCVQVALDGHPHLQRVDVCRCGLSRVHVGRGHKRRALRQAVQGGAS